MPFIKHIPYGNKIPSDVWTTCQKEIQIWQELTMLRHVTGTNAIYAREATSSYIDQAKIYFLDASKSNWRSSGLLYYYSFLNLAKAHLVTNRAISGQKLKSTSIYHGLTATPQNPTNIINFKIEIHPPGKNKNRNIFSHFYQKLVHQPWPFKNVISISISDVISYCDDISHEMFNFYNIQKDNIDILSLARKDNSNWWFEILIPDFKIPIIQSAIGHCIDSVKKFDALSEVDKSDWLVAHNVTVNYFHNHSLVRINQLPYTSENENQVFAKLINDIKNHFNGFIIPTSSHTYGYSLYWHFVPKLNLNGQSMKWHPLLSNYLFAFMLSSVLRYQPHLFRSDSRDAFIAEAWCNQSASSSLRYFLLELSKQNVRINA
jgi:hypothetical protein